MAKKKTITKIMTLKDYITLAWMFEKPNEPVPDLCEFDPSALLKESKYSFRLTDEQKNAFDDYFDRFVTSGGVDLIMSKIPKIKNPEAAVKRPVTVTPAQPEQKKAEVTVPLSADSIDYVALVESVERGDHDFKSLVAFLDDNYGSASKILSIPASYDIRNMRSDYSDCEQMYIVIQRAEVVRDKISAIMNEPEPELKDTLERFKKHVMYATTQAANADTAQYCHDCDEVEHIEGKQIIFSTELDKISKYDDSSDMKNDVIYLIKNRKLDADLEINVFGKPTSGNKIIAALYKKHPNGVPGGGEFYASNREAYLAGALKI